MVEEVEANTYSVLNFGAHNAIDGHAVCTDYEVDD